MRNPERWNKVVERVIELNKGISKGSISVKTDRSWCLMRPLVIHDYWIEVQGYGGSTAFYDHSPEYQSAFHMTDSELDQKIFNFEEFRCVSNS